DLERDRLGDGLAARVVEGDGALLVDFRAEGQIERAEPAVEEEAVRLDGALAVRPLPRRRLHPRRLDLAREGPRIALGDRRHLGRRGRGPVEEIDLPLEEGALDLRHVERALFGLALGRPEEIAYRVPLREEALDEVDAYPPPRPHAAVEVD